MEKYEDFVKLYNNHILVREILRILDISQSKYRRYYTLAKNQGDIIPRKQVKRSTSGKYYYVNSEGKFVIKRMFDNKLKYFGTYPTEEQAKLAVEIFELIGWNTDYLWNVKAQVLEEFNYKREE